VPEAETKNQLWVNPIYTQVLTTLVTGGMTSGLCSFRIFPGQIRSFGSQAANTGPIAEPEPLQKRKAKVRLGNNNQRKFNITGMYGPYVIAPLWVVQSHSVWPVQHATRVRVAESYKSKKLATTKDDVLLHA